MRIFKNNDLAYDDPEPDHGFTIGDYELLDLIDGVEQMYANERWLRDLAGDDAYLLQGIRSKIEQAAVDIVSPFWDDEVWIVVYDLDRAMGGPEEGGWSYPVFSKISQHRIEGSSWAEIVRQARTAEAIYREYYQKLEYGTPGSFGPHENYAIEIEIVPQGWERHYELHGDTVAQIGPGKLERQGKPRWS